MDVASFKDEDDNPVTYSQKELVAMFEDANGDGQPFIQVWCVEDDKQVLGYGRNV